MDAHTCTWAPQACSLGSRQAAASSLPAPTCLSRWTRASPGPVQGLLCFAVFRSLAFKISPKGDSDDGLSSTVSGSSIQLSPGPPPPTSVSDPNSHPAGSPSLLSAPHSPAGSKPRLSPWTLWAHLSLPEPFWTTWNPPSDPPRVSITSSQLPATWTDASLRPPLAQQTHTSGCSHTPQSCLHRSAFLSGPSSSSPPHTHPHCLILLQPASRHPRALSPPRKTPSIPVPGVVPDTRKAPST